MRNLTRTGQSTAEYAVLIGVVIATVVGMQLYVKRGLNSKVKGVVDQLNFDSGCDATGDCSKVVLQYEPYYTAAGAYRLDTDNTETAAMVAGGKIAVTGIDDSTTRTGTATQGADLAQDNAWTVTGQP